MFFGTFGSSPKSLGLRKLSKALLPSSSSTAFSALVKTIPEPGWSAATLSANPKFARRAFLSIIGRLKTASSTNSEALACIPAVFALIIYTCTAAADTSNPKNNAIISSINVNPI